LLIKALNAKTNLIELILMVTGFMLTLFWIYLISCISDNIKDTHKRLKQEEITEK